MSNGARLTATLLLLVACSGTTEDSAANPTDPVDSGVTGDTGDPNAPACGDDYTRSEYVEDIRGPYCEWLVNCLGLGDDVESCGALYTSATMLDALDPCRVQTCTGFLQGDMYACETENVTVTPLECIDPYVQDE